MTPIYLKRYLVSGFEGGNMNDIKLVEFILNHQLQYQIGELVNITGETRKTLLRVIKKHNLYYCIKDADAGIINDINSSALKSYTISQLSYKHKKSYPWVYRVLKRYGFLKKDKFKVKTKKGDIIIEEYHYLKSTPRRNAKMTAYLLEMLKIFPVVMVSRAAKELDLRPRSRQGLYDLCIEYGIIPLKMGQVKTKEDK